MTATLIARLGAFERRARAVRFVAIAPAFVSIGVAASAVMASALTLSSRSTAEALGGAVVLALGCAAIAAAMTTRDAGRVAASIDARLGLRDHVVSALQFAEDDDEMSRAVVRSAIDRLRVDPRLVFPFERPRHAGWTAAVAVAAAFACFARAGAARPDEIADRDGRAGVEATAGSIPGRLDAPQRGARDARPAAVRIADDMQRSDRRGEHSASISAASRSVPTAGNGAGTSQATAGEDAADQIPSPPSGSGSIAPRPSTSARSGGSADGTARSARPGGAGGADEGATASMGTNGSAGPGGVQRGALEQSNATGRRVAANSRADLKTAAAAAESAIAQQRVPVRLRQQVRDYFVILQRGERR